MLITPDTLKALETTLSTEFREGYGMAPFWHDQIGTTVTSTVKTNTYGWMARLPTLRQWIGPRTVENLSAHEYTLTNLSYELTVGVPREDIEDDNLGIYAPMSRDMGEQARRGPDTLMAQAVQAGVTTNSFDGVPFFDNAHPLDPAGTQDNNFTGTALNSANYATVRGDMGAFTGEDGLPLGVVPNLLVVPPQLEEAARTILNADLIVQDPGTANSATRSNVFRGSANLLVVPQLANEPTTWYLLDTSRPIKPFIFQQRKAPEFVPLTQPDNPNVFFNKQFVWGVDSRGAAGYSLWFLASRCIA